MSARREREPEIVTHHRRPQSTEGGDEPRNLSRVQHVLHVAWHKLFKNAGPVSIAAIINRTWLDPDWKMIAVPAEIFMGMLQIYYWRKALKENKREGMDGDNI
jgi:hypothetical protein